MTGPSWRRVPMRLTRALVVGLVALGGARAGERPDLSFEAAFLSGYTWRGQVLNDEPVFQPSATATSGALSFNVWGNVDLTDNIGESFEASEVDLTTSYAHEFDKVALEVGVILYQFPHTDVEDTGEIFVSVGVDTILDPTVTLYSDFDEVHGLYLNVGIGHAFALGEKLELGLEASIAAGDDDYHEGYFGVDQTSLSDAGVGAALTWAGNDRFGLGIGVHYAWLLNSTIEDAADAIYFDDSELTLSVAATFEF